MSNLKKNSKRKPLVKVEITAHDRWSAPESYIITFKRKCDATRYVNNKNGKNTLPCAPDYYETAKIIS
jgi:hypothetical protein